MNVHLLSSARLTCLVLLGGLALLGCGEGSGDDGIRLSELKKFDAYPLYYGGEDIAGHKLEEIIGPEDWQRYPDPQSVGFVFIYGTCEPAEPSGLDGEVCTAPIQLQVSNICESYIGRFRGGKGTFELRGARAGPGGGGVEVFTGRTAVDIHAHNDRLVQAAVRGLRVVGRPEPAKHLPPPIPGAFQGKLPCQQKRG